VVSDRVEAFRAAMAALGHLPDWVVSEASPIENPSPFRIFMTSPQRLRVLAGIAAEHADRHRAVFLALSHSAAALADALSLLDHASQEMSLCTSRHTGVTISSNSLRHSFRSAEKADDEKEWAGRPCSGGCVLCGCLVNCIRSGNLGRDTEKYR
jgi:hypothetical protein